MSRLYQGRAQQRRPLLGDAAKLHRVAALSDRGDQPRIGCQLLRMREAPHVPDPGIAHRGGERPDPGHRHQPLDRLHRLRAGPQRRLLALAARQGVRQAFHCFFGVV